MGEEIAPDAAAAGTALGKKLRDLYGKGGVSVILKEFFGIGSAGAAEANPSGGKPNAAPLFKFRDEIREGTKSGIIEGLRQMMHEREAATGAEGKIWNASYGGRGGGGGGSGGGGSSPAISALREKFQGGSGRSPAGSLTALIDQEAKAAGIDPRVVHGIRAGESWRDERYDKRDDARESSWGPFQLNRRHGPGVQFEKDTGLDLRDRSTIPAQTRWVANYLAKGAA